MPDFILLMHDDAPVKPAASAWPAYLAGLRQRGVFEGGSAVGDGICVRKDNATRPITQTIGGYLRVTADTIADVRDLLPGNPVYEAGGTIEIRELPIT